MTKMVAMPIYGKNPSKFFFSETNKLISRKLGVKHRWLKYSNVYIQCIYRSRPCDDLDQVYGKVNMGCLCIWIGKTVKMSFEGKCQEEMGKWTEYCLKKENGPWASSAPALELNTIIFKHVYWYMQQISGERLQDHWSSGLIFASKHRLWVLVRTTSPRRF